MALDRLGRLKERGDADRRALDQLLDSQLAGVLSTVIDGEPWSVPLLYARDGDRILLHGSTGAGALRQVRAGAPGTFCVLAVDGIVVAHSTFDSSANYRSAVIRGHLEEVPGLSKDAALQRISDTILPGRTSEVRGSTSRELSATLALSMPIRDGLWLYKARSGGPSPAEEPVEGWCGVVPMRTVAGEPIAGEESQGLVPASVRRLRDRFA